MRILWQPRFVAIAVLLLAGATAFGIAVASGGGSPPNLSGDQSVAPVTYSSTYDWTPTIPSSASTPAAIVSAIANRAGLGKALRVSLTNSPSQATRQGSSLNFDVATDGSVAGNIHAAWMADLVQGAIAEAFVARGMQPVIGSTVTGDLPNGQTVDLQGGMGDVAAGQSFSSDSDAAIQQHLEAVLAQANLTPVSITVMHIGQPAPAVIVKTSDPSSAAAAAATTIRALFGANPPLYEGYYFEIDSAGGTPIIAASASFRTGAGRQWVDPSVAATSSLIQLGGLVRTGH
ncbi:MAG TPA: hypothetical protein VFV91_08890 [Gaiellaceae bacterium]|nr:hypothetical protein [Gaiellaceae bacterium]